MQPRGMAKLSTVKTVLFYSLYYEIIERIELGIQGLRVGFPAWVFP